MSEFVRLWSDQKRIELEVEGEDGARVPEPRS